MDTPSAAACYALVPAAGSGARMGADLPKQYLPLLGRPLIWHTLAALAAVPAIAHVFVVLAPDDTLWHDDDFLALANRIQVLRCGGATRANSVAQGLATMRQHVPGDAIDDAWVLVHDAARPCVTPQAVERLIDTVRAGGNSVRHAGGILSMPVADTLKRAASDDTTGAPAHIAATVPRDGLWQAQTPQMFRHAVLLRALDTCNNVTDEASALEAMNVAPLLVVGEATNFKVTWPGDLALADIVLRARQETS